MHARPLQPSGTRAVETARLGDAAGSFSFKESDFQKKLIAFQGHTGTQVGTRKLAELRKRLSNNNTVRVSAFWVKVECGSAELELS